MDTCVRFALLSGIIVATSGGTVVADDWPQWGGPHGDNIWRESGIVERLPNEGALLPRRWSVEIAEGYAGPAVAAGRVYVTDYVRSAQTERIHCIDAETGAPLWNHEWPARYTISYPAGPRATPVIDGGLVYVIGAVGHMFCLQADSGDVVWQKQFQQEFRTELPTWGMAAAPLVDGDKLIVLVGGSDGGLVVCFNKQTGEELWRALNDPSIGYCPPVIYEFGGRRQLIIWHPQAVSSLDPDSGELIWNQPFDIKAGLTIAMPRKWDDRLFVTAFYDGPMMLDVGRETAGIVWKGNSNSETQTDKLHGLMCTPVIDDGHIYGICSHGQLRCLNASTGERIWETLEATGSGRWWNAFIMPHQPDDSDPAAPHRCFIHNEQGDLIIASLSPAGYKEISRARLVEPTRQVQRRMTIWSQPAFAMKSVFARNDKELVRVDLAK